MMLNYIWERKNLCYANLFFCIDYVEIYLSVKFPSKEMSRRIFLLFYWFFSRPVFFLSYCHIRLTRCPFKDIYNETTALDVRCYCFRCYDQRKCLKCLIFVHNWSNHARDVKSLHKTTLVNMFDFWLPLFTDFSWTKLKRKRQSLRRT